MLESSYFDFSDVVDGFVETISTPPPPPTHYPSCLEQQEDYSRDGSVAGLMPNNVAAISPSKTLKERHMHTQPREYDFSHVSIPKCRLMLYMTNWVTTCAPLLDKSDIDKHFTAKAPVLAKESAALLYALLAFSARQYERTNGTDYLDSLELYQKALSLLAPSLQTRDAHVPLIVCILACLELMSGQPQDWRRHAQGCATLFKLFNVNGLVGGIRQAVFWCYARMDVCGCMMSDSSQSTVLPLDFWLSDTTIGTEKRVTDEDEVFGRIRSPDMHANWMVYLCAKVCDLAYRETALMTSNISFSGERGLFEKSWAQVWLSLQSWHDRRPPEMRSIETAVISDTLDFPQILFLHNASISSNQMYHAACIKMLQIHPRRICFPSCTDRDPHWSVQWHARRICGISETNPHTGSLVNMIQPLCIAGGVLTHPEQHMKVARLLVKIERLTGWGAIWGIRNLERVWGYDEGEISRQLLFV
ncbi:Transcription activator AMTR1 [Pseudocercospora fuligena]|uniref:Transcription activator AMTR1 n=1 Tax=Pseudocercospora fuligena TaxID=685502 RepID=A0A8H6RWR9_9PEZI|nr:Transcription activator AMTR1 [Pseudocercospora fuligena]